MKPRIESRIWITVPSGSMVRRWHVLFRDACGCDEDSDFPTFATAVGFACHVAGSGDRWEFVA